MKLFKRVYKSDGISHSIEYELKLKVLIIWVLILAVTVIILKVLLS